MLQIDTTRCQGHGACVLVNAQLFDMDDDGYGVVLNATPGGELENDVRKAISSCPEGAISQS